MPIQNPMEQKEKIINSIKTRGPCLPVHVASAAGINTIFAGAFLSDLASDKTIKISHMKVGGSPLYYLPGQEELLEKFFTYLNSREKEAFSLLKERKILEDTSQEPAIRVALRNIKDFAHPIAPIISSEKVLFWRFHSFPEEQAKGEIEKLIGGREIKQEKIKLEKPAEVKLPQKQEETIKQQIAEEIKPITEETSEKPKPEKKKRLPKKIVEKEISLIEIFEKQAEEKPKKIIEKSDFVKNLLQFLEKEDIELLEEREFKKKDYQGIVRINSDLGKIKFLLVAKEKKSISDTDLIQALQKIQSEKMPILFLAPGNLNKKAQSYIEKYSSLIKFKQLA